ncbi:MAG: A24 family peptidase C-terminal domain-containing protein [Methanomicrobiales archaeon]|nr:A24 family peptidase C-terminal domain-containing protein [Methanomicrobiales archaeon]
MVSAMILPLAISASAVLITLLYASLLDLKDRRVPFRTWYPMLVIALPATSAFYWIAGGSMGPLTGFVALAALVLYAYYLDSTDTNNAFNPVLLIVTLALPAVSWFVASTEASLADLLAYAVIAVILLYATFLDMHERLTLFRRLYIAPVMIAFAFVTQHYSIHGTGSAIGAYIAITALFCALFYTFGALHLFGGADAWALILLGLSVPIFPIQPLLGYPVHNFLPFTVLTNAVLLNLAAPLGLFIWNVVHRHRAPLPHLFFGYPVPGDHVEHAFGFVMEEIEEEDTRIERRFIPVRELLLRMFRGQRTRYTKDLRNHPERYQRELALYRRAGHVWILYGVPFILPITAGFVTAVFLGDVLYFMMQYVAGV